jgi:hypothetical protein
MATYREESNSLEDLGFMMSEIRDLIESLPARIETGDIFSWDELIYSPQFLHKALRKISLIADFEAIDPIGIGFNAMFPAE